jgi:hypothetical protein
MGLSRTTALLDLSLTFPFDHFFFLLRCQYCSCESFLSKFLLSTDLLLLSGMLTYPALEPACAAAAFWAVSSATVLCTLEDYMTYLYS